MKGPIYRSDDYQEAGRMQVQVGVQGTREEVEAYEAKQRDPFANMRFPYDVSDGGVVIDRSGRSVSQEASGWRQRKVIIGGANLLPLLKAYKEARIAERGEQHLLANPRQPVLWHIKELFDAYDKVAELARKV